MDADLRALELRLNTARVEGSTYLVEVDGELDLYSAPNLLRCFERLADDGARTLIVDLSRTPFIDSTGLGVLIAGTKMTRTEHGNLHVVGARPSILTALDSVGARAFLSVLPRVADALALA